MIESVGSSESAVDATVATIDAMAFDRPAVFPVVGCAGRGLDLQRIRSERCIDATFEFILHRTKNYGSDSSR